MQGITIERIPPLFAIGSLDHDRYPGAKSRYLAGDAALVNLDLLKLSGLLSSKETRQHALGISSSPPSTTIANCVSNTQTNHTLDGCPCPQPPKPPTKLSAVAYPPPRGVPLKCVAIMMREDKSYLGCHFNHPRTPHYSNCTKKWDARH